MNHNWLIKELDKINLKNTTLIVGLPGIGNVGKITIDLLNESLKTKPYMTFYSKNFPSTVMVEEDNLISTPLITLNYKNKKKGSFLFLTGDLQPSTDKDCYDFCKIIDDVCKKNKVETIITLGGIGLKKEPTKPKLYITGNNKKTINQFSRKTKINKKIFGVVGPIMGVSGLLPAVTEIDSIILLAETIGSPLHVGIKGAKEIIKILNEKFNFKINLKKLNEYTETTENEKIEKINNLKNKPENGETINYFG